MRQNLAAGPATTDPARPAVPSWRLLWLTLGLVSFPVLLIDQASKLWIVSHLKLYETIPLVPHWLDLTYTLNPGAAFSLFAGLTAHLRATLLLTVSIATALIIVWVLARSECFTPVTLGLGLILGGAGGNLIDRAVKGRVVDFIYVHYRQAFRYPVFNLADSAITIGVALILFEALTTSHADTPPPEKSG